MNLITNWLANRRLKKEVSEFANPWGNTPIKSIEITDGGQGDFPAGAELFVTNAPTAHRPDGTIEIITDSDE